jgi:hypothetical protein
MAEFKCPHCEKTIEARKIYGKIAIKTKYGHWSVIE